MIPEYHKIDSVYLRDPKTKFKTFLIGEWSRPEFGYLSELDWEWTEKIDGTNVRVAWSEEEVSFHGRTDKADLPSHLLQFLQGHFSSSLLADVFGDQPEGASSSALINSIVLYGEGYGPKIQKGGGLYRETPGFILFDVKIGPWWLKRSSVEEIASSLRVPCVPVVGFGNIADAIEAVRESTLMSKVSVQERPAEGLVLRPIYELTDRGGRRIITKIKAKDFQNPPRDEKS